MKTILAAINAKYIHTNLAIRYIRACSPDYGFDLFEATINENPLQAAWAILSRKPDLVGFSCYIWNIDFTLKVCGVLKAARPDMIIVLGGPEADFDWKGLMERNDCIDYILRGEGELSFRRLYEHIAFKKHGLSDIGGLCYRKSGSLKTNAKEDLIDLDILPFPYEGYEQIDKNRIYYYESSRGCPFNCSYCLSSTIKGVRHRSIDRVKSELMWFIERDVPLVKFIDRTFNSNKRYSMDIWSFLMEHAGNTRFHFEIEADLLDEEMLKLLSQAPKNLFQFEIGVQTTNNEVLKNINRVMDFSVLSSNIIKIVEQDNIQCHLDLIAGLPGENMESFRMSFDDCMEIRPQMLQLGFLKVLKGSPMMDFVERYDLRYMPCAPYQILSTRDMGLEDMGLLMKIDTMVEDFYNSGILHMTMDIVMEKSKSKFGFFKAFSFFGEHKGYFSRRFDIKDKFGLLYDFACCLLPKEQLKQLMALDYLISTKKAYLPEFLKLEMDEGCKIEIMKLKEKLHKDNQRLEVFIPMTIRPVKSGRGYNLQGWKGICQVNVKNGITVFHEMKCC